MKYPDDMDKECVRLCDALNKIYGVETFTSCSGHGQRHLRVWFLANNFDALSNIAHSIRVLNMDLRSKKANLFVGCNDVGSLHYELVVYMPKAFENAESLAFLLE